MVKNFSKIKIQFFPSWVLNIINIFLVFFAIRSVWVLNIAPHQTLFFVFSIYYGGVMLRLCLPGNMQIMRLVFHFSTFNSHWILHYNYMYYVEIKKKKSSFFYFFYFYIYVLIMQEQSTPTLQNWLCKSFIFSLSNYCL